MTTATRSLDDTTVARHQIANLLAAYLEAADRKDVEAAVAVLGQAEVSFPAGTSHDPETARALFTKLWGNPTKHRHDLSNLLVLPGDTPGTWIARAHYTRYVLTPEPVLNTLGEYDVVVDEATWTLRRLIVTRTWVQA
ncbi:nuclear transport factor 2 family protein [Mangrovihabitans endophyticus]|uniref:SnoaL-like domain-containing protein n=1 Tax=Mangrovihabitans endophyticus TaxID=1751298 RepID=A0A8J3FN86_9ACTN|nr:nuclear transport factor 2 family protein [Mangrovihabitans endophyticus]GGK82029.1 hypothetical protein GCM10012284_15080 [Mangrovihabitans endophyticus]